MLDLPHQHLKAIGHDITNDHLIMRKLANLLKEYAVMMMQLYQVLGEKKLTVQNLCTQLKLLYTTLKNANNCSNSDTVLSVQQFMLKKPFRGKCSTCGRQGHNSADYWEKEKNASKWPPG